MDQRAVMNANPSMHLASPAQETIISAPHNRATPNVFQRSIRHAA